MMNVVELKVNNVASVPDSLRNLAAKIEAGDYGEAHNLAWVIDKGFGKISVGLLGESASPAAECHYLFGLGMSTLENMGTGVEQ